MQTAAKPMLSVPAAAEYLGLSQRTIWGWIYERRVPSIRLGRAVRLRTSDLDKFIEAGTTPALDCERR